MFPTLHVEVLQSRQSNASEDNIVQWLRPFFDKVKKVTAAQKFNEDDFKKHQSEYLLPHIVAVNICDVSQNVEQQNLSDVSIKYHVYRLDETGPHNEMIEDGDGDKTNEISAASQWILPSVDFHGLWESLIYESRIKENLLQFIESTLVFSDRFVDSNIISWNRVVLLHGPPGTGKTSLCKALAQKLSIRLSDRYTHGQLVEINSHSLFSKWFSESGKLVMKMFAQIREMIEDRRALVCVLIDEVESLAHTRQSSLAGSEPSDSIRVVNAVLTQLDQIRRYPNVLILTTSNITGAIDLAFVDRADIKQYIPLPTARVIYEIYRSCIQELFRTGIICPEEKLFPNVTRVCQVEQNHVLEASYRLFTVALASEGISGRSLRKIPFLAHALFVSSETTTLGNFLIAMSNAVAKHIGDSELLTNGIKAITIEDTKTVPISDMNGH